MKVNSVDRKFLANFERKRWSIVIMAIVVQLCLGTVYAWSVFKNDLVANQGWNEVSTSMTFMICIGVIGLAAAFGGNLVDRLLSFSLLWWRFCNDARFCCRCFWL